MKHIINTTYKKAEMSMTVIVSAVLALVVLIVLIYIFLGGTHNASTSFGSCGINGGSCEATCPTTANPDGFAISGVTCTDAQGKATGQICCSRKLV